LQAALRRNGHDNMSVYNFGVEDADISRELSLLKHYKDIYGIDQVIFFTGGADVLKEYLDRRAPGIRPDRITSLELYRTIDRIRMTWFSPSPARLPGSTRRWPESQKTTCSRKKYCVQMITVATPDSAATLY
jgi:hypothetical protein